MRSARFGLLPALLVPAVLLTACGGGDDSSSGDSARITDAIRNISIGSDPGACTEFATPRFLEQTEAERGDAAVDSCKQDQVDTADDPTAVETTAIKVEGDSATATTAFTGGTFDGQSLDLSLIEDDGEWKVDRIEDVPNLDVKKFAGAIEASVHRGSDPLNSEEAKCIGDQVRKAGSDQLTQIILDGDSDALGALIQACAG